VVDVARIPERVAQRAAPIVWAAIWLWPLIAPAEAVWQGTARPRWLAGGGLTVYVGLYLYIILRAFSEDGRRRVSRPHLAALFALAVVGIGLPAVFAGGPDGWLSVMLYVGAAGAASLQQGWMYLWVAGTIVAEIIVGGAYRIDSGTIGANAFSMLTSCLLVFVIKRMIGYIYQLRETQAALAETAVAEERLRFSRDLHDLLGHTLSLVVVKAEVVRRLLPLDQEAAAKEAADIETIGRNALAEVREAVTGYRERSFADELDGARTALADAGIAVTVREAGTPLAPPADALFGWAVREGVTNILRHSHARNCEIVVHRTESDATLRITDDGVGTPVKDLDESHGNGLRGLTERLTAAGGDLRLERPDRGGFQVVATLPAS
jgi:two-component system sensor histidine kinase DesK